MINFIFSLKSWIRAFCKLVIAIIIISYIDIATILSHVTDHVIYIITRESIFGKF